MSEKGRKEGGSLNLRIVEVHVFVRFFVSKVLWSYGIFGHCFCGRIAVTCDDVPGESALGCMIHR
jgi:hypothetical protein